MIWSLIAKIAARPAVAQWLYRRAAKTPYFHLDGYMNRWWLFNPITTDADGGKHAKYSWLPVSVRLHHILRPDHARHPHNHPGSFRTLIAMGWYVEERDSGEYLREAGQTSKLLNGEFHHVSVVSPGGVWTVFIMWGWTGRWGFRIDDGTVVPHQDYTNGGKP